MRKALMTAVTGLALMAAAGPAGAQEVGGFAFPGSELGASTVQPGQIYGGLTKSVIWMQAPEWTYGSTNPGAGPTLYDIHADGTGLGFNAFLGMGLDFGIGQNPRLQLSGGYAYGRLHGANSNPAGTAGYLTLDGTDFNGLSAPAFAQLEVEHEAYEFALRALTDLPLGSGVTLTPSVMVFGSGSMQDYQATMTDAVGNFFDFQNFAEQDVDAYQVGVEGALAATFVVGEGFTAVFGGRGALLHLDAEMDGSDCHDGSVFIAGCDAGQGSSTVSDDYDTVTYRAGLFAGTSFDLGPHLWNASFGLFGSIDWLPFAAIRNPDVLNGAPSHLVLRHEMQYAISATFMVPLN